LRQIHIEDVFGPALRRLGNWNVKVKGQKSRSPGPKNVLCTHNTPAMWTEWNAVVADNVAQAAGATIRSLQRGVFAGMSALAWATPPYNYQC